MLTFQLQKKVNKHNWFLLFTWIAGVFIISHRYRQISDNWGITSLVSFLVYRFFMWHVPQIFHRFSVRLSNKFLKIECHHGTKLIKNMNSIVRWGWVWYKKLCRTDRLVLFGLGFIPEVVVFDCLVGIKCVKYCELFPYCQLSARSPFPRAHSRLLRPKVDKSESEPLFFFFNVEKHFSP